MSEKIESESDKNEKLLRDQVVDGLRSGGIEDSEVNKKLIEWTIKQEERVESAGRTVEARVNFEIEKAKLYFEGGYIDEAFETLDAVLYVAEQENRNDLIEIISDEILRMEG